MNTLTVIKSNWFSRKPHASAELITTLAIMAIFVMTLLFFNDGLNARTWMAATVEGVLEKNEVWRLWTALFAHADLGHFLSNALLFVPLSYFLNGYFGFILFPALGFFMGGVANFLTLQTMGAGGSLIGASGVVFWMGATWLTLYVLLESKESLRRRLGKSLAIGAALFLPQSFEPNISYMCHLYGFVLGLFSGLSFYLYRLREFQAAEIREVLVEEPAPWEIPDEFSPELPAPASNSETL